jgi:hypothetical protein
MPYLTSHVYHSEQPDASDELVRFLRRVEEQTK